MAFRDLFPRSPLIGVVHLLPLPGSPRWAGDWQAVEDAARSDAATLAGAGADGIIVENFGDAPFHRTTVEDVTVAAMAVLTRAVREEIRAVCPVGVNVLRNDAIAALAVATAARADFIRVNVHTGAMVTDQGIIEGGAAQTMRERARLGSRALVFADVWVKHATPLGFAPTLGANATETYRRGLADALIVTGAGTGEPVALEDARAVRSAVPEAPLLIGSGVEADTLPDALEVADGVIVGTAVKVDGVVTNRVDPKRARAFFNRRPAHSHSA